MFDSASQRWYIGMNHIYSSQAIGQEHIDLLALDNNFNVMERQHVTSDNFTRPHFVLKGNYVYMTYDKPGAGVYLHKYLIQNTNSLYKASRPDKLFIYPDPANTYLNIVVNDYEEPLTISFYNTFGAMIKQIHVDNNSPNASIDCSEFPTGLYFVKTSGGQVGKFSKF